MELIKQAGRIGAAAVCRLAMLMCVFSVAVLTGPARAQDAVTEGEEGAGGFALPAPPYINPYRDDEEINIVVFGDSLSQGLWASLDLAFKNNELITVRRQISAQAGLAQTARFDWNKYLAAYLAKQRVDVAVVMLGTYDSRSLRAAGRRYRPGTPGWRQAYAQRVDQFIRQLKRRKIAIYWIEIPPARNWRLNQHIAMVNAIVRERARVHQVKFISTRRKFSDAQGKFAGYGSDATGRIRRLRTPDGLHFSWPGNALLANLVKPGILADIVRAQGWRNVELTGKAVIRTDGLTRATATPDKRLAETGRRDADLVVTPASDLRDGAPTPVIEPVAEPVAARTPAGVADTDMRKVKADSTLSKVMLRGEKLAAKPGRADDFTWRPGGDQAAR